MILTGLSAVWALSYAIASGHFQAIDEQANSIFFDELNDEKEQR